MTFDEFRASLKGTEPPRVSAPLRALWHAGRGEWAEAHAIAQDIDNINGAWVHALVHRQEGDLENARYWYRRAEQPPAIDSLDAEWQRIVSALLTEP